MTYKVYAIGGLSIIATILALGAYSSVGNVEDFTVDDNHIIATYQNSEQWNWIKGQVINAEESKDIQSLESKVIALEKRVTTQSQTIDSLDNRIKLLETEPVASTSSNNSDEILTFYTSDGEREEDRFDQGEIVYFIATIDSNANYLYYEIWNDDDNDEIKDRRIEVRDNKYLAWAWSIPTNQTTGDYYIEIDLGDDNQKVFFDVK
ncbi:MAG: hypothetical protein ABGW66_05930 [Flavobacteriaceae bacterium]|jgi:hypothetical protein